MSTPAAPLRLLHWNIRHGGGRRLDGIAGTILAHAPDVVVLTEFRTAPGGPLLERLAAGGLDHRATSEPRPRVNGVALLARTSLELEPPPDATPLVAERWLEARLPAHRLAMAGVYLPPVISVGVEQKQRFWDVLLAAARERAGRPFLIVGDLNTGAPYRDEPRATLHCSPSFLALGASGWVDAWRRVHGEERSEWSWLSPGRGRRIGFGYRLDHVFLSPPLAPRLRGCAYDHGPRDAGLSDHSLLLLELEPG